MKSFLSLVAVLAMASSLWADVIFSENFEGGVAGTSVAGTDGWVGSSDIVFSSTVIDQGQSVDWSGGGSAGWPLISKGFTYSPSEELYELTATLYSPDTGGADAEVWIRNGSDTAKTIGAMIAYGTLQFGIPDSGGTIVVTPQPLAATDVKIILEDNLQSYSYRAHGETAWIDVGSTSEAFLVSDFNEIGVHGHATYPGAVDSILLTTATAEVPEPAAFSLLLTGMLGLIAFGWQRRK